MWGATAPELGGVAESTATIQRRLVRVVVLVLCCSGIVQVLLHGVRTVVDGAVGAGAWTDAILVAASLFGVAGGALLRVPPRWLAVTVAGAALVAAGVAAARFDVEAALVGVPHGVRVVVVAVALGACAAPLGALVGGLANTARRDVYAADLAGGALGVLLAAWLSAGLGVAALCAGAALVALLAVPSAPPSSSLLPSAPAEATIAATAAAVILAAAVGLLQPTIPALLAPATAGGSWVLSVVVAGALLGGTLGAAPGGPSSPSRLLGIAAVLLVLVGASADLWRAAVLAVLVDTGTSLVVRLGACSLLIAAPIAALSACSARALVSVLDRRHLAATAGIAGAAGLAAPLLASIGPERVAAVVGVVVAVIAVALDRRHRARHVVVAVAAVAVAVAPPTGFGTRDLSRALLLGDAPDLPADVVVFDARDPTGRTVVTHDDDITLFRDGKPDASVGGDVETQALLALLPLLYAPAARSAVVVGLGSGATARWFSDAGLQVDVAEISPRVVEASALFGEGPLPPSIRVHVGDARALLAGGHRRFDLVSVEATNLFVAGSPRLFSVQALRTWQAASRSGVVVVWAHAYLADDAILKVLAATASAVFEQVDVYGSTTGDLFFVGHSAALRPDPGGLAAVLGDRLDCGLAVLDRPSLQDLATSGVRMGGQGAGVHDDLQPRLVLAATAALLSGARAAPSFSARPPRDGVELSGRTVTRLLATEAGRARLRTGAGLRLVDDGHDPSWAMPLARAGLAALGDGARPDDVVAAIEGLSMPRCARLEDVDVALHVAHITAQRAPSSSSAIVAALQQLTLRRSKVKRFSSSGAIREVARFELSD